jgi:uncharacterized protein (TIGR00730 family)
LTSTRICVFCGSSPGVRPAYAQAAREVGSALARRKIGLVYGGGSVGMMGAVADAALAAGGEVIGVIPESLVARELAHAGVADLRVVRSMHERKALMAELSDAFLTLPGAFGTLDETCEMLTWNQLGIHAKPCGILDVGGYFGPLLRFLDQAVEEGFLQPESRALLVREEQPERLIERLLRLRAPEARSSARRRRT